VFSVLCWRASGTTPGFGAMIRKQVLALPRNRTRALQLSIILPRKHGSFCYIVKCKKNTYNLKLLTIYVKFVHKVVRWVQYLNILTVVGPCSLLLGSLIGLLYQSRVVYGDDCGAISGMNEVQEKPKYPEETCPSAYLFTKNPRNDLTWARTRTAQARSNRLTA
jgi:hypothetical protein